MPAGYTNLTIESGATFITSIEIIDNDGTAMDLSYYNQASCKMRKSYYSNINVYNLTVVVQQPPSSGVVVLSASSTETASFKPGRYVYDIELTDGTSTIRVLEGMVIVKPNATK